VLTLPHPSYLSKLSIKPNAGITNTHLKYLLTKIKTLTDDEKVVNLVLDEIHVKVSQSYKAGKLQGNSDYGPNPASSLQAYVITSLKSKNKYIVALYPV